MFNNHRNSNKAFIPTPSFKNKENWVSGFTLIELLVVVAIIGILSGVVIASLNSAREKGKIAAIKSTLKNMQSQAEITYLDTGSYASLFNYTTSDCIGPLANMASSLTDKGIIVKCYSINSPTYGDRYLRFGATAIIYDTNELKAWSTDQNGVSKWDTKGVNTSGDFVSGDDTYMNWYTATSACSKSGGRLPAVENLKTIMEAYYSGSNNTSYAPPTFTMFRYWASNSPQSDENNAYRNFTNSGAIVTGVKATDFFYVRCVR